jgi:glycerophosphoryl diester phosphodiesterase
MEKQPNVFDVQGHRGARGIMPENTLEAFKKAIDCGVTTLEMDVVISKDRKVVVSHEPHFNPDISTKPDGSFFNAMEDTNLFLMDYEEIKKIDVGTKGNPNFPEQDKIPAIKPLLSEVIEEVSKYLKTKGLVSINYNIELKSLENEYQITQPEVEEFCQLVLEQLDGKISPENLTLQSFDFNVLNHLHKINSKSSSKKFFISVLIEPEDNNDIDFNLAKLDFLPDIWSPYFKTLDKNKVDYLHKMKIKVIPWTVNNIEDMKSIKEMGCDGLITDFPNFKLPN